MQETIFYNVTITIQAESPKEAYAKLCTALASLEPCEYSTDTYVTLDPLSGERETRELWPSWEDESKSSGT